MRSPAISAWRRFKERVNLEGLKTTTTLRELVESAQAGSGRVPS